MKVRILRTMIGSKDQQIEENYDVMKIEEFEHYQIILHCYNGSSVKVDLKDILYISPFVIVKREGK